MLSSILVIGGTGMIGQHLVTASLDAGHPTAILVRPATADADAGKAKLMEAFESCGASLVYVSLSNRFTSASLILSSVAARVLYYYMHVYTACRGTSMSTKDWWPQSSKQMW